MTLLSIQSPSACPEAHEVAARTQHIWGLHLVLLKPSTYDNDGYVLRHWQGVLPSSTLACLYALAEDVPQRRALPDGFDITVEVLDKAEWERVLWEALLGRLKPLYNFLEATPDLSSPPVPMPHQKYLQRYEPEFATGSPV